MAINCVSLQESLSKTLTTGHMVKKNLLVVNDN